MKRLGYLENAIVHVVSVQLAGESYHRVEMGGYG